MEDKAILKTIHMLVLQDNLKKANDIIKDLSEHGYKISLDDSDPFDYPKLIAVKMEYL